MNYAEAIHYIYEKLPMFSRMGSAAYKKDLTNIRILCSRLNNPQHQFKSIHVAGTNGKGSVSHMLAAIFHEAGYRTGLYTSPHLYDFRERIKIDGKMIDEDYVSSFIESSIPVIEEIEPSFFEITVAMAFSLFAEEKVEIAIIEVGLGGRLDSTNIITPELSVITNIGWDHMNILGNSLEEIAFEKAGIIKENIPVVIGEKKQETIFIFQSVAATNNASIYFAEDSFHIENYKLSDKNLKVDIKDLKSEEHKQFELDLPGIYQTKNIVTVLQAIKILNDKKITDEVVHQALRNVRSLTGFKGRWELIHEDPSVVLEVAHNKEGIEQMLLHVSKVKHKRLHIIIGTVKDKDVETILIQLPSNANYYFTNAHIPRALDYFSLQCKGKEYFLNGKGYDDVNDALQDALLNADIDDLIIVCGSLFLVAEVNKELIRQFS
ncbi:MAG: bifunctional folylpolyglutamate synthase/dihydrofolate synthase [Flavisolibacter sp.]